MTTLSTSLAETFDDPNRLSIGGADIRHSVLVLPLDAPVPSELGDIPLSSGSFYKRLAPLDVEKVDEDLDFSICLLTGSELMSLDRAWPTLVKAQRVFALFGIPGAQYDVLFTQAVRMLGLRRLDWSDVADQISSRVRTLQRTKDSQPFLLEVNTDDENSGPTPSPSAQQTSRLARSNSGPGRRPRPFEEDVDVDN